MHPRLPLHRQSYRPLCWTSQLIPRPLPYPPPVRGRLAAAGRQIAVLQANVDKAESEVKALDMELIRLRAREGQCKTPVV